MTRRLSFEGIADLLIEALERDDRQQARNEGTPAEPAAAVSGPRKSRRRKTATVRPPRTRGSAG